MTMIINPEGLARGADRYGPKPKLENIIPTCVCGCEKKHHGSGGCMFCNVCKQYETGGVKTS